MSRQKKETRFWKYLLFGFLLFGFFMTSSAFAEVTVDDLLDRIEKIEQKNAKMEEANAELARENAALKAAVEAMGGKQPANDLVPRLEKVEQANAKFEQANTKLEQSNASLSQENAALKSSIASLEEKQKSQDTKIAAIPVPPVVTANFLETKFKAKLYGYVKVDGVYSDSASAGVITMFPVSETTSHDDDAFNMSLQETRLGIDFTGPELEDGGKITGKVETDFVSTNLRIRHAYAKLAYKNWDILGGQTWDFFSPLGPSKLNMGYGWNAGNIGDRHGQLILSNNWGNVPGGKLSSKVGILDTGVSNQTTTGVPVGGALLNYDTTIAKIPTTLYVAGIMGAVESGTSGSKYDERIWAGTSGLTLKFADWISLKAEGYNGSALNAFRSAGFSTTGVDTTSKKGIDSQGGFVELSWKPTSKIETNYGLGVDKVTSALASSATSWKRNAMLYTNIKYSLTKDVLVGLELERLTARFSNGSKGDVNRIQTSIIYKF